jgi:hypothetical protein
MSKCTRTPNKLARWRIIRLKFPAREVRSKLLTFDLIAVMSGWD